MGRNSDGLDRARGVRRGVMSVMSAVAACAMVLGGAVAGAAGQCEPRWTRGVRAWNTVSTQYVTDLMLLPEAAAGGSGRVLYSGRLANPADGTLTVVGIWNSADQSVEPLAREMNGFSRAVARLPNGDVLVGGSFTGINGVPVRQVARRRGLYWEAMGWELNGTVEKLLVQADGTVVAIGSITSTTVPALRSVARWDGVAWRAMSDGLSGTVSDIVELPGVGLLVSGGFTQFGIAGIARWDGRRWVSFDGITSGSAGGMLAMQDGSLVTHGGLVTAGGSISGVLRWDRQSWSTLSGLSGTIYELTEGPGGKILAVGELRLADQSLAAAALWDGTRWTGSPRLTGDSVRKGVALPNGDLLVAMSRGDPPHGPIPRYLVAGVMPTVDIGPTVTVACPGELVELTAVATGTPVPRLHWQKGGELMRPDVNPAVNSSRLRFEHVTLQDGGIYSCEVFNGCGSVTSRYILLHVGPCACSIADVAGGPLANVKNPDAMVDGNDFVAFINAFAIGDAAAGPQADVAGGGANGLEPDGEVDAADFVEFVNAFVAGC